MRWVICLSMGEEATQPEVHSVPILTSRWSQDEADEKVRSARLQLSLAIRKLDEIFEQVQAQAAQAKEELGDG